MKKIFLLLVIFTLMNCEIKVRETQSQTQSSTRSNIGNEIYCRDYTVDNITYKIFYTNPIGSTEKRLFVVNHTKELLEVELLKKELSK